MTNKAVGQAYEAVRRMFLDEGLNESEIVAAMGGQLKAWSVRTYLRQVIQEAKEAGIAIPQRKSPVRGGFVKLNDRPMVSPLHRSIGAKLNYHREFVLKMSVMDFCQAHHFLNHISLRELEMGVASPTLSTLERVAEILGVTMAELVSPQQPRKE